MYADVGNSQQLKWIYNYKIVRTNPCKYQALFFCSSHNSEASQKHTLVDWIQKWCSSIAAHWDDDSSLKATYSNDLLRSFCVNCAHLPIVNQEMHTFCLIAYEKVLNFSKEVTWFYNKINRNRSKLQLSSRVSVLWKSPQKNTQYYSTSCRCQIDQIVQKNTTVVSHHINHRWGTFL